MGIPKEVLIAINALKVLAEKEGVMLTIIVVTDREYGLITKIEAISTGASAH